MAVAAGDQWPTGHGVGTAELKVFRPFWIPCFLPNPPDANLSTRGSNNIEYVSPSEANAFQTRIPAWSNGGLLLPRCHPAILPSL